MTSAIRFPDRPEARIVEGKWKSDDFLLEEYLNLQFPPVNEPADPQYRKQVIRAAKDLKGTPYFDDEGEEPSDPDAEY